MNIYDLPWNGLASLLNSWNYSNYHARRLWQYLYREKVETFDEMEGLRPDLRSLLISRTELPSLSLIKKLSSKGEQTEKGLFQLSDNQRIESVLMRFPGRTTACISTQVGCAMGCVFCATGQMGFQRNLSTGEIVVQVLVLSRAIKNIDDKIRNVVLMGMGEPLHNYEAVMDAIAILTDDRGLAISPRRITLSTVGLPKAIRRLADDNAQINLAVSLHAANDQERSEIVPINRRWNLAELIEACHYYSNKLNRRVFVEWALIQGRNDSVEHAQAIGRLLRGLDAHVNLIPLNPTSGFEGLPSSSDTVKKFQATLLEFGLPSTVRRRKGIDIDAGCGQLRDSLADPQISSD